MLDFIAQPCSQYLTPGERVCSHYVTLCSDNMAGPVPREVPAYDALLTWYPLRDRVASFLGDRDTYVFPHAISEETECLICSTLFRRIFIEAGDDPDTWTLTERQRLLVDYGRRLANNPRDMGDALYALLAREFTPPQLVVLTAFGGLMIATNVFSDAPRVDRSGTQKAVVAWAASGASRESVSITKPRRAPTSRVMPAKCVRHRTVGRRAAY